VTLQGAGADGIPTMEVEVLFWGRSGEERLVKESVSLPQGATVDELLCHLCGAWGFDLRAEMVDARAYFLTLNGSYCDLSRNRTRRLKAHDSVAVLPLVAGG
jgi:molybdopterin converting factor small subunit